MGKIFFTSDNHFSHQRIHQFCPSTRPDADIDVMDRKMIERWQAQVQQEDDVFILGDVFWGNEQKAKSILRQLSGNKHLIYGNHDKVIRESVHIRSMFDTVREYAELNIPQGNWILFHYPIQEWNKMSHGAYHLHGHIHNKLSGVEGRIANVCIDSPTFGTGDYSLYELEKVKRYLDSKPLRQHHTKAL